VRLGVRVIPNSARTELGQPRGQELVLRVSAPAVDGKANQAARQYLARCLGVRASAVRLVAGEKSRHKKFEIVGLEARRARQILNDVLRIPDDTGR
jgi:uncharacterized protein YggU (UPF0235/DUF167 family)